MVLVPLLPEVRAVTFSVYIERPGANLDGWPGKNADRTLLKGRVPMAQGTGTCCVIAKHEPLRPSVSMSGPRPSADESEWMRHIADRGAWGTTVVGRLPMERSASLI